MNTLPILVQGKNLSLVEVDGQAVITAADMAKGLGYQHERSVRILFERNKASFRDFGVYDLTRGHQFDAPLASDNDQPLPRDIDTALVQILTPSAADGRGGGLQNIRVFTKRGALKVCMKSNQPRAIAVQEALIDLYEKFESGQLIGAARFGRVIETLTAQVAELKRDLRHIKDRPAVNISLPDDAALPIALERQRGRSMPFYGGFRFSEVREFVIELRRLGYRYAEIADAVKARWPLDPERHVSKSAVHRFWAKARHGRLKDHGIDVTVH